MKLKEEIENRPRRFGKSTLVNDSFLISAKAGKSVEYQHPDYICMSRTRYKELITQIIETVPCEETTIPKNYRDNDLIKSDTWGYNRHASEVKAWKKKIKGEISRKEK